MSQRDSRSDEDDQHGEPATAPNSPPTNETPRSRSKPHSEPRRLTFARRAEHLPRAAVVGILAGLVAVGFRHALHFAEQSRERLLAGLHEHPYWGWAVLPVIGLTIGCAIGWIVRRFAPDAPGSGIPHIKGVLTRLRTLQWRFLLPVKFISGVFGIGAGLSLGREGPTVQMGAAVGAAVGEILRVPKRTMPQLISCGAGAGLAAAFNAPLAGFIFVLEELHREFSSLTYGGALVAAVAATTMTVLLAGDSPSFSVQGFTHLPLIAMPLVALVGLCGGLVGVLFNRSLLAGLQMVDRLKLPFQWTLPGIAGVVVGLAAWWIPDAIGGGHSVAEKILSGKGLPILTLLILLVAKLIFTTASYASGAPGGIFAPMLLMGAILGSICGQVVAIALPDIAHYHTAFAVLGMAAFFTSSVRAPLTGTVLILEMTAKQEQLFSLCIVCMVSYLVAETLRDRPIYEALFEYDLRRRGFGEARSEPTQLVVSIQSGSSLDGRTLRGSGLPRGCLVVEIERAGRTLLPSADMSLVSGDLVTIVTSSEDPSLVLRVQRLCENR